MEHFIRCGDMLEDWPVHIEPFNGVEGMLKPGVIEAELKISGLRALGVLVDANSDFEARWRRNRERALSSFPITYFCSGAVPGVPYPGSGGRCSEYERCNDRR